MIFEAAQGEARWKTIALGHGGETSRLFAPDIDVQAIAPRPVSPAHHAVRGEVCRLILESLRTAAGPTSAVQLAGNRRLAEALP